MKSKPLAINTLMQLGIKARESGTQYNQLCTANSAWIQSINRPLCPSMDNVVLHDLDAPQKLSFNDLDAFLNTYVEFYKSFFGNTKEDEVIKKDALALYDDAMRSSDFETVLMVKIIKELQESDNYRFILMGMAWSIDNFDSNFELFRRTGKITEGISMGTSGLALIMMMLCPIEPIGVALGLGLGLPLLSMGICICFLAQKILANKVPHYLEDATKKNTISGRYGYFTHVQSSVQLEEIVLNVEDEDSLTGEDQLNQRLLNV